MFGLQLIDNWRAAPRMMSMWCFVAIAVLQPAWPMVEAFGLSEMLWSSANRDITATLAVLGIIGRLLRQQSVADAWSELVAAAVESAEARAAEVDRQLAEHQSQRADGEPS